MSMFTRNPPLAVLACAWLAVPTAGFICSMMGGTSCRSDVVAQCNSEYLEFPFHLAAAMRRVTSSFEDERGQEYPAVGTFDGSSTSDYDKDVRDDGIDDAMWHASMNAFLVAECVSWRDPSPPFAPFPPTTPPSSQHPSLRSFPCAFDLPPFVLLCSLFPSRICVGCSYSHSEAVR